MMYGKHYASMYTGSMVGSGAITFAVMGYVVANQKPDKIVGSQVELNPKLLGFILGESSDDVQKAIDKLCAPDPKSRSKEKEGRRLVRLGQFDYQVVNGATYMKIRNEEERKIQNREAQRRYAARASIKKTRPSPTLAERLAVKAMEESDDGQLHESPVPYQANPPPTVPVVPVVPNPNPANP